MKTKEKILKYLNSHNLSIEKDSNKIKNLIVVKIRGDYNDADYNTTENSFYLDYFIKHDIGQYLKILYDIEGKRLGFEEFIEKDEVGISDDILDYFEIPAGLDAYCHTIDNIKTIYYDENGNKHNIVKKIITKNLF